MFSNTHQVIIIYWKGSVVIDDEGGARFRNVLQAYGFVAVPDPALSIPEGRHDFPSGLCDVPFGGGLLQTANQPPFVDPVNVEEKRGRVHEQHDGHGEEEENDHRG